MLNPEEFNKIRNQYELQEGKYGVEYIEIGNGRKLVFSSNDRRMSIGLKVELPHNRDDMLFGIETLNSGGSIVDVNTIKYPFFAGSFMVARVLFYRESGEMIKSWSPLYIADEQKAMDFRKVLENQGCIDENNLPVKINFNEVVENFIKFLNPERLSELAEIPARDLILV